MACLSTAHHAPASVPHMAWISPARRLRACVPRRWRPMIPPNEVNGKTVRASEKFLQRVLGRRVLV
eukprot:2954396-Rhodomonas_salina.1